MKRKKTFPIPKNPQHDHPPTDAVRCGQFISHARTVPSHLLVSPTDVEDDPEDLWPNNKWKKVRQSVRDLDYWFSTEIKYNYHLPPEGKRAVVAATFVEFCSELESEYPEEFTGLIQELAEEVNKKRGLK